MTPGCEVGISGIHYELGGLVRFDDLTGREPLLREMKISGERNA
jgi:hypothetical protein